MKQAYIEISTATQHAKCTTKAIMSGCRIATAAAPASSAQIQGCTAGVATRTMPKVALSFGSAS
jgi:hypothetical protein